MTRRKAGPHTRSRDAVRVVRDLDGEARLRPSRWASFDAEVRDAYDYVWEATRALREVEQHRDEAVRELRQLGVSWHTIGLALGGVTGEAARQKYGGREDA